MCKLSNPSLQEAAVLGAHRHEIPCAGRGHRLGYLAVPGSVLETWWWGEPGGQGACGTARTTGQALPALVQGAVPPYLDHAEEAGL